MPCMQYDRSTFASESLAPPQIGSFQELAAQSGALTTRPAAATPPARECLMPVQKRQFRNAERASERD